MSLRQCKGNILKSEADIICQQVNCKGVMGAGLAKQIKELFPQVFFDYKRICDKYNNSKELLGKVNITTCYDSIFMNIFGQYHWGKANSKAELEERYNALKFAFEQLAIFLNTSKGKNYKTVAFPYKFGCGLAGADWNIVFPMLEKLSKDVSQEIQIWNFE